MVAESSQGIVYGPNGPRLLGSSLAASLICLFIGLSGYQVAWPPMFDGVWVVVAAIVPLSLVLSFAASRRSRSWVGRLAAGLAILVNLAATWPSLRGYLGNYQTYPWLLLFPFAAFVTLGCLYSRQVGVFAGVAVFAAYWLEPAFTERASPLPRTLSSDGLTLTMIPEPSWQGAVSRAYSFALSGQRREDLDRRFDLDHIEATGDAGPLIPISCWSPRLLDSDYLFEAFVPQWARSWNLTIRIHEWPKRPGASVLLPIPPRGADPASPKLSRSAGYSLVVSDLKWVERPVESAQPTVLSADVSYAGFLYSGSKRREIRIVDDRGRTVSSGSRSTLGFQGGATERIEMETVSGKSLRFELIPDAGPSGKTAVFRFDHLPNER